MRHSNPVSTTVLALFVTALGLASLAAVAQPPRLPSAEELLRRSIAHHDPEGSWGSAPVRLELTETRPSGSDRSTTLNFDAASQRFELERSADGVTTRGVITRGRCSWDLVRGEMSAEDKNALTCERLTLLRNYYDYLWGLPMKLEDPGTVLGSVTAVEADGAARLRLRVTYEPEIGDDIWDFDFDPESHALVGYRFFHDEAANDGEWISLDGEIEGAGLRLPRSRSWYTNAEDRFLGRDDAVRIRSPGTGER